MYDRVALIYRSKRRGGSRTSGEKSRKKRDGERAIWCEVPNVLHCPFDRAVTRPILRYVRFRARLFVFCGKYRRAYGRISYLHESEYFGRVFRATSDYLTQHRGNAGARCLWAISRWRSCYTEYRRSFSDRRIPKRQMFIRDAFGAYGKYGWLYRAAI